MGDRTIICGYIRINAKNRLSLDCTNLSECPEFVTKCPITDGKDTALVGTKEAHKAPWGHPTLDAEVALTLRICTRITSNTVGLNQRRATQRIHTQLAIARSVTQPWRHNPGYARVGVVKRVLVAG